MKMQVWKTMDDDETEAMKILPRDGRYSIRTCRGTRGASSSGRVPRYLAILCYMREMR